eukprot:1331934-Rhodomonas_salina.1
MHDQTVLWNEQLKLHEIFAREEDRLDRDEADRAAKYLVRLLGRWLCVCAVGLAELSGLVLSCLVWSGLVVSCRVVSFFVFSCFLSALVLSRLVSSRLVSSRLVSSCR